MEKNINNTFGNLIGLTIVVIFLLGIVIFGIFIYEKYETKRSSVNLQVLSEKNKQLEADKEKIESEQQKTNVQSDTSKTPVNSNASISNVNKRAYIQSEINKLEQNRKANSDAIVQIIQALSNCPENKLDWCDNQKTQDTKKYYDSIGEIDKQIQEWKIKLSDTY